ncbi:MAG: pepsin-like aspartic protease, partial [Polyangia bacterium]
MTLLRYLAPLLLAGCGGSTPSAPDGGALDGSVPGADGGAVAEVVLGGCYSAHTMPVTFGASQTFQLNVDTGSASLGVAETACASCTTAGVTPLYAPGAGATDLMKPVSSKFDTGELGWSGEAYRDVATIGGLAASVDLAAITDQTQYFFDAFCDAKAGSVHSPYQGIIGFAPDTYLVPGTTSWMTALAATKTVPDVFALSLCHVGGRMWLGGYDEGALAAPVAWVPMNQQSGYRVAWRGVGIGAKTVAFPVGTLGFTDSGGPGMIVPDASFAQVASALAADASIQSVFGATFFSSTATGFENCVTLADSPASLDAKLPTLDLQLGPADAPVEVKLGATHSYLTYTYLGGDQVTYCQGLIAGGTSYGNLFYIGQSVMLDRVVVHDRANARMGFAPVKVS